MNQWYLGTIGFSYKDWVGRFYPKGITQRGYLSYYTKNFNTVELNTTFHAIPRIVTVQSWADSTPADFRFCLKSPRTITHELSLVNALPIMNEFLDAIAPLESKCGPILIQMPPKYSQNNFDSLREFLISLPKTHRYAIEFRNISWYNDKTATLLSENQIGWVAIDYPNIPMTIYPTTDFLYIRWIGINNLYHYHTHERVDKTSQLEKWLEMIHQSSGTVEDIYGFFNNDYAGFAAGTCIRFKRIAGISNGENILIQDKFI